jgi:hypothetical protein
MTTTLPLKSAMVRGLPLWSVHRTFLDFVATSEQHGESEESQQFFHEIVK